MLNGLYSVRFNSSSGNQGSGVVAFIDSRAYGGDASYFYKGEVEVDGADVSGHIHVARHQPGESIFGPLGDFTLDLSGTLEGNGFRLQGGVTGQPALTIRIDGTKIAEL